VNRISLSLPTDLQFLGVPDAVLLEIGGDMECCTRGLEDLGSAVIEACTNAMEHGNALSDQKTIEVIFEIEEESVTVTVLDEGPGFDFEGWRPSEDLMRQRGRGILIMREFCDTVLFGRHPDGRFMIRLTKLMKPAAESAEDPAGGDS